MMQSLTSSNINRCKHFMKLLLGLYFVTSVLVNKAICQISASGSEGTLAKSEKLKLNVTENTNHGKTSIIYVVTNTKLYIYQKPFDNQGYREHVHTVHQFKSQALLKEIRKLNLDKLNPVYLNNCVMPGTGNEYHILLANGSSPVSIKVYQYYKSEVDILFQLLNKHIPQSFQIRYLTTDNKQDCGT